MFDTVKLILVSNVLAPLMALNVPYLGPLRIKSVKFRDRGLHADEWGVYMHSASFEEQKLKETPAFVSIRGTAGWKNERSWHLVIDTEEGTVGTADWSSLTGYTYMGSAAIGIAVFGIPGLLLTLPAWVTTNLLWYVIDLLTPLNAQNWAIYLKLAPQLDKGVRSLLWKCLKFNTLNVENSHNLARAREYELEYELEEKMNASTE